MRVDRAARQSGTPSFRDLPFPRRCTRRCVALFERQRRQIKRREHENERLRLTLLSAFLHYALGMTTRNICAWLRTFCHFQVTPGGLVLLWQRLAEVLLPLYEELGKAARLSAVLNADESGWRIGGRLAWLWCFTSKTLTYYRCRSMLSRRAICASRSSSAVRNAAPVLYERLFVTLHFSHK